MPVKDFIEQDHYPHLELYGEEKDIIEVWQNGKFESNVIHIEREKVEAFIKILQQLNSK